MHLEHQTGSRRTRRGEKVRKERKWGKKTQKTENTHVAVMGKRERWEDAKLG